MSNCVKLSSFAKRKGRSISDYYWHHKTNIFGGNSVLKLRLRTQNHWNRQDVPDPDMCMSCIPFPFNESSCTFDYVQKGREVGFKRSRSVLQLSAQCIFDQDDARPLLILSFRSNSRIARRDATLLILPLSLLLLPGASESPRLRLGRFVFWNLSRPRGWVYRAGQKSGP